MTLAAQASYQEGATRVRGPGAPGAGVCLQGVATPGLDAGKHCAFRSVALQTDAVTVFIC